MDESVVKHLEQPVGTLKLSEAIRECGYGNPMDYADCVLGRAYFRKTGRRLDNDGNKSAPKFEFSVGFLKYTERAALEFDVPPLITLKAEQMCYGRSHTPEQIADWLAAQGY